MSFCVKSLSINVRGGLSWLVDNRETDNINKKKNIVQINSW